MRHKKITDRLGRFSSLRKATVRDIAKSVLKYQSVVTTKARARATCKLIDRLISLGKGGSLAARRRAFSLISDHDLVKILFTEISPRYRNRQGGYTRVLPLWGRRGDNASQVVLELTEKVIKEKIKVEKPRKETVRPPSQEIPEVKPVEAEVPAQPVEKPKPKPEVREKPVKKAKIPERPQPVEKPKPKEAEKPKPKAEKPKGLFGGLGKLFKRQKDT